MPPGLRSAPLGLAVTNHFDHVLWGIPLCSCYLPSHILLPRRSYPQQISWDLPSICLSIASLSLLPRTLLPFCGCSSCWWSPGDSSPCICVCLVLFLWKGVAAWLASIPGIPWKQHCSLMLFQDVWLRLHVRRRGVKRLLEDWEARRRNPNERTF